MMDTKDYDMDVDIAWCPGCGDFAILNIVKQVVAELSIDPKELVIASGIGQAAKLPHYLKTNVFNGLHGRPIPAATAIKAANPELTVIVNSGDGDIYGEGGNHFIHAIRRNTDLTIIVHNNMVYGLTKGQASPTSQPGFKTPVQVGGVFEEPFNPIAIALAANASFVARAYCGDIERAKGIVKKAVKHKGFSLVDMFQPCVTYNKLNTYDWFKENTYYLKDSYKANDRVAAFKKALETEKFPLGVFYSEKRSTFVENLKTYQTDKRPLYKRNADKQKLKALIDSKRRM